MRGNSVVWHCILYSSRRLGRSSRCYFVDLSIAITEYLEQLKNPNLCLVIPEICVNQKV